MTAPDNVSDDECPVCGDEIGPVLEGISLVLGLLPPRWRVRWNIAISKCHNDHSGRYIVSGSRFSRLVGWDDSDDVKRAKELYRDT